MSNGTNIMYKSGGILSIISGILFLTMTGLTLMIGTPPSTGAQILTWATSNETSLAIYDELIFFSTIFLIPVVIALYYSLATTAKTRATAGCGILAVTLPILLVMNIVHGRLMYPVYDISITNPASLELITAIFYSGQHLTNLMIGPALIVIGLAARHAYGTAVTYLSVIAGIFAIIGSDPWIIGPALVLVSGILFALWLFAVGAKLYGMR